MPLFNNDRDSKFARHIQKEMVNRIASIEVALYKIIHEQSRGGIYMEMNDKTFADPVRLYCSPKIGYKEMDPSEYGMDSQKTAEFSFLPDNLKEADVVVEEGDIIEYDDRFYQVSKVSSDIYWSGRNKETSIRAQENEGDVTGNQIEIRAECYSVSKTDLGFFDDKDDGTQDIEHFGDYTNLI